MSQRNARKQTPAGADQKSFLRAVAAYAAEQWPGLLAEEVGIKLSNGQKAKIPIPPSLSQAPLTQLGRPEQPAEADNSPDAEEIVSRLTAAQRSILVALRGSGPLRAKRLYERAGGERAFFAANAVIKGLGLVELAADGYTLTPLGEEVAEMLGESEAEEEEE